MFSERGYEQDYDLHLVAQQGFLYVEVARHLIGCDHCAGVVQSSSSRHPLGRLRYLGEDKWAYHPYLWAGEDWDDDSRKQGTADDLMLSMLVEKL